MDRISICNVKAHCDKKLHAAVFHEHTTHQAPRLKFSNQLVNLLSGGQKHNSK